MWLPVLHQACVVFCCSKAAKLIMLGFNMVPVPPFEEVCELITGTCAPYQEWRQHESLHRLNTHQLTWVKLLAGFRSSYRLVSGLSGMLNLSLTHFRAPPDLPVSCQLRH